MVIHHLEDCQYCQGNFNFFFSGKILQTFLYETAPNLTLTKNYLNK